MKWDPLVRHSEKLRPWLMQRIPEDVLLKGQHTLIHAVRMSGRMALREVVIGWSLAGAVRTKVKRVE
jgi:hypothetical protein